MQISGATVLLTGASGGLGSAIARSLSARGGELILSARRVDALERLAGELGARALPADLALAGEVERLAQAAGDVDILIANAAVPAAGRLETFTRVELDRALDINLRAPLALAHALSPGMVQRGRGHLVFISSTAGKLAAPANPVYHTTKYGLRGMAAALRIDLRPAGVGVSCVFPGFIRGAGMFADSGARLPPGVGTRSPSDVAQAVLSAIECDRGEIDVATPFVRAGTLLFALAPDLTVAIARRLGADDVAAGIVAGHRQKR